MRAFIWELCGEREVLTAKRLRGAEIMPRESQRERERVARVTLSPRAKAEMKSAARCEIQLTLIRCEDFFFIHEGLFCLKGNIYGK